VQSHSQNQTTSYQFDDPTSKLFGFTNYSNDCRRIFNFPLDNQSPSPSCTFQVSPTSAMREINISATEATHSIYARFL
jgi:hypothetical protein